MSEGIEFLLRLLEHGTMAHVGWEDLTGEHGDLLRACQAAGFLGRTPLLHPVPSCPHCGQGVPYRLGRRHLCNRCGSAVASRYLRCWRLDAVAFWSWLASALKLCGRVRRIEEHLWQLGTWNDGKDLYECFARQGGAISDRGEARLAAYRDVLVLHGVSLPPEARRLPARWVSLLHLLRAEDTLSVTDVASALWGGGRVRFDDASGTLWAGDARLGDVPVGCKEYWFLRCLAEHLDHFVPYADLKRSVVRRSGSRDATEEATFCQKLKNRVKQRFIPEIDRLLATTNKGDGYRLRGLLER